MSRLEPWWLQFENDVDDCIHVVDVDCTVAVQITLGDCQRAEPQDVVDDGVHVVDVDSAVAVHVALDGCTGLGDDERALSQIEGELPCAGTNLECGACAIVA